MTEQPLTKAAVRWRLGNREVMGRQAVFPLIPVERVTGCARVTWVAQQTSESERLNLEPSSIGVRCRYGRILPLTLSLQGPMTERLWCHPVKVENVGSNPTRVAYG